MQNGSRGKPRLTLTRAETRALLGLAILLFVGILGQQCKRYLNQDPQPVVIEGAEPLEEVAEELPQRTERETVIDSPRLDAPTSQDVTSTPKTLPASEMVADTGSVPHFGNAEEEKNVSESGDLLNVNQATSEELQALPGIGPVLASRILEWRRENGSFETIDDLLLVRGIGKVRLEKLRALVTVEP